MNYFTTKTICGTSHPLSPIPLVLVGPTVSNIEDVYMRQTHLFGRQRRRLEFTCQILKARLCFQVRFFPTKWNDNVVLRDLEIYLSYGNHWSFFTKCLVLFLKWLPLVLCLEHRQRLYRGLQTILESITQIVPGWWVINLYTVNVWYSSRMFAIFCNLYINYKHPKSFGWVSDVFLWSFTWILTDFSQAEVGDAKTWPAVEICFGTEVAERVEMWRSGGSRGL